MSKSARRKTETGERMRNKNNKKVEPHETPV